MRSMSRPLLALLLGTVAFFALWLVALKPKSGESSGSLGKYQSAVNAARGVVAASGGSTPAGAPARPATTSASRPATTSAATTQAPATTPTHPATTAKSTTPTRPATTHPGSAVHNEASSVASVALALTENKVVALLFYNPAAADDQAVKQELAAVPLYHGKVVKFAVPLSRLGNYSSLTTEVPVEVSPTLVLIGPKRQASTIVGFADRFEIAQRVLDDLP